MHKKVLICTPLYPPDIGGPATYSKLLEEKLPKFGFSVKVLSFGLVRRMPKIVRHLVYFFRVLKDGARFDIIYAQDPVSVGLPSLLAAKVLRRKFILKIVGDYAWEQFQVGGGEFVAPEKFQTEKYDFVTEARRRTERWVAKRADKIIVPSKYLKKIVLMWGVPEEKVSVVYNAFDVPSKGFSKEEARRELGLEGPTLISAGRLVPWKGFGDLVEIMPDLLKKIPNLKLVIIGDGPERENLKFKIKNLKLGEQVFLKGQLKHEEVLECLHSGDVFVLNTGYEGLSHQLLEAMAAGIPIVTTDVGGNPELIKNGESGFLVDYADKNELKNAIIDLYGNGELRDKFTVNARQKLKEFNTEKMINEIARVLKI